MSLTGRLRPRKAPQKAPAAVVAASPALIARQARIAELRRLVASGKYKVEPHRLAEKILTRALKDES